MLIQHADISPTQDTFTGVDTSDLTSGVFNGASLLEGNDHSIYFVNTSPGLSG
jgi:hypothetical protein